MIQWVNADRTVLVRVFQDADTRAGALQKLEVATRPEPDSIWGPPIVVERER